MTTCNRAPAKRTVQSTNYRCANAGRGKLQDYRCPAGYHPKHVRENPTRARGSELFDIRCVGDAPGFKKWVMRYDAVCEKDTPRTVDEPTELKCCRGELNAADECPIGLCPGSPACDAVITNYCGIMPPETRTRLESAIAAETDVEKAELLKQQLAAGGRIDDPWCGCALPSAAYGALSTLGPLQCVDRRCIAPAAVKLSKQNEACNITSCSIGDVYLSSADRANLSGTSIAQTCGQDIANKLLNQPAPSNEDTSTPDPTPPPPPTETETNPTQSPPGTEPETETDTEHKDVASSVLTSMGWDTAGMTPEERGAMFTKILGLVGGGVLALLVVLGFFLMR